MQMSKVEIKNFITDAKIIMKTEYPPTKFIVKDILPSTGLAIIAGPSKAGKSLFTTHGKKVSETGSVTPCTVRPIPRDRETARTTHCTAGSCMLFPVLKFRQVSWLKNTSCRSAFPWCCTHPSDIMDRYALSQ